MSSLLPLTAPPPTPARDAAPGASPPGTRADAPASAVETARAPRPVAEGQSAQGLRGEGARDKPVGPPPAFDINVLQDIRARLVAPADPPADQDNGTPAVALEAQPEVTPDPIPVQQDTGIRAGAEAPHALDKKV